jgi:hypothetical protein
MRHTYSCIISQRGRLGAAALLLIFFAGFTSACGGCGSEEESSQDRATKEKTSEQKEGDGEASSMTQRREIFGLPLPPSVVSIEDKGPWTQVKSAMTLDEIKAFFESRLTDYELLEPRHQIRLIGLRDYMPEIYAYGSGDYTFVVYRPPASPEDQAKDSAGAEGTADGRADGAEQGSTEAGATASRKAINQRKRGEQVLDRTSDGELLAPGARWGVPYTPPPGSHLDQKRLRSNFGRPYGEWMLQ